MAKIINSTKRREILDEYFKRVAIFTPTEQSFLFYSPEVQVIEYGRREIICHEHPQHHNLYYIARGIVGMATTDIAGNRLTTLLSAHHYFPHDVYQPNHSHYPVEVQVYSPVVQVIVFPQKIVRILLENSSAFQRELARDLYHQFRMFRQLVEYEESPVVRLRVRKVLQYLGKHLGQNSDGSCVLPVTVTGGVLSRLACISRATLTKNIKLLEDLRLVERTSDGIVLTARFLAMDDDELFR